MYSMKKASNDEGEGPAVETRGAPASWGRVKANSAPGLRPGRCQMVVFSLSGQDYALLLPVVERVVWAVELKPLPKAPDIILGLINFRGRVVPVANIRKRFGLPHRQIELNDHFIIANTARRCLALAVEEVRGVAECGEGEVMPAGEVLPKMDYVSGVAKLPGGIILVHDLDAFLSLEEERALGSALRGGEKMQ